MLNSACARPEAKQDQPRKCQALGHRKNILRKHAHPQAARVGQGQDEDCADGDELEGVSRERNERRQIRREGQRDGGDGIRLNHQERRPAVKESAEGTESFTQIDELPAGERHPACELGNAKRARQAHHAADHPDRNRKDRTAQARGHKPGHVKEDP